jgi:hypothetical protein
MVIRNVSPKEELFQEVLTQAKKVSKKFYVVDHGSDDNTKDIVRRNIPKWYTLDYVKEDYTWTMDEMKWKHSEILMGIQEKVGDFSHIFILDWDEVISDSLIEEINNSNLDELDIFYLKRHTFFLDKIISWDEFLPLLYRPSFLHIWPHEKLHSLYRVAEDRWRHKYSKWEILHYSFKDIEELIRKTSFYAKIEWYSLYESNPRKNKYIIGVRLLWKSMMNFIYSLFVRGNILHFEWIIYSFWILSSYNIQYMYYNERGNFSIK